MWSFYGMLKYSIIENNINQKKKKMWGDGDSVFDVSSSYQRRKGGASIMHGMLEKTWMITTALKEFFFLYYNVIFEHQTMNPSLGKNTGQHS